MQFRLSEENDGRQIMCYICLAERIIQLDGSFTLQTGTFWHFLFEWAHTHTHTWKKENTINHEKDNALPSFLGYSTNKIYTQKKKANIYTCIYAQHKKASEKTWRNTLTVFFFQQQFPFKENTQEKKISENGLSPFHINLAINLFS